VVPLGVRGGLDESNLSSYLVAAKGTGDYICLDAGTLYSGIQKAIGNGAFQPPASRVLRNNIVAYFISHAHLDHVAGLIINSPDDSAKFIYGLQSCLNVIRDKYFSWQSWANFGDEGEKPQLNKYHYAPLTPGRETAIQRTNLSVQAWPLSHGAPYESAAFMVRSGDSYLLYLGDTGADSLENSSRLHTLWLVAGPLLRAGKLKAIFIETSFPNEQPDKLLFGHLTPRLLMQEMQALANIAEMPSLETLNLVITHRKPSGNNEETIRRQLEENNPLKAKLIFPEQGKRLDL
jgi:3',5'-cyclic-nucleotide phosphodiesterase